MNVEIEELIWDDFNVSHIARHKVRVSEVEMALEDKNIKFFNAHSSRFVALGSAGKRLLSIIIATKDNNKFYVVTARDASKRERRFYLNEKS
ncbi:MAG: BrnT family toxin [candidate division WWE3 bacterium]|nr:BrnT family toxin [candidate division WWE3 bacterium]